jgi:hypothetical protein
MVGQNAYHYLIESKIVHKGKYVGRFFFDNESILSGPWHGSNNDLFDYFSDFIAKAAEEYTKMIQMEKYQFVEVQNV